MVPVYVGTEGSLAVTVPVYVGTEDSTWVADELPVGSLTEVADTLAVGVGTEDELEAPHEGRGATLPILDTTQDEASSV
jgi:hypothetical protein